MIRDHQQYNPNPPPLYGQGVVILFTYFTIFTFADRLTIKTSCFFDELVFLVLAAVTKTFKSTRRQLVTGNQDDKRAAGWPLTCPVILDRSRLQNGNNFFWSRVQSEGQYVKSLQCKYFIEVIIFSEQKGHKEKYIPMP